MLGQFIQKGDYVISIDVYAGSCDGKIHVVADFTPAKVRTISEYRLRDIGRGEQFNGKVDLNVPTRLIVINEDVARNVFEDYELRLPAQEFDLIEEFRQTLLQ